LREREVGSDLRKKRRAVDMEEKGTILATILVMIVVMIVVTIIQEKKKGLGMEFF
jgi:hypothetical protein